MKFDHCIHKLLYLISNVDNKITSCPESMTLTLDQSGSVDILCFTKYLSCSCRRAMKTVPGVMQLLSNLFSVGRTSPVSTIFEVSTQAHTPGVYQCVK